ncbi:hypothetical protein F383_14170 [Gossypium arboreum]|uniref:Uncharacterized protein n=1 Tax=Gossypium arboreum TaxID=29729 RepID=A0A0B0PV10_GOSAR|nr:hypothetical protein F383_14170 [Gossypium arboreum]
MHHIIQSPIDTFELMYICKYGMYRLVIKMIVIVT